MSGTTKGGETKDGGAAACPICGRPAVPAMRPFCSKRCADVDLSRWLGGVYRIESGDGPETGPDAGPDAGEGGDGDGGGDGGA